MVCSPFAGFAPGWGARASSSFVRAKRGRRPPSSWQARPSPSSSGRSTGVRAKRGRRPPSSGRSTAVSGPAIAGVRAKHGRQGRSLAYSSRRSRASSFGKFWHRRTYWRLFIVPRWIARALSGAIRTSKGFAREFPFLAFARKFPRIGGLAFPAAA
jgi:hypothetical protein